MSKNRPSSKRRRRKQELASNEIIDELNIIRPVCGIFQENTKKSAQIPNQNDKICRCGLPKSKHKHSIDVSKDNQTMPFNTHEEIDPAYGQIRDTSLFVQLALNTPLDKIERILLEAWNIPKPRFLVSIIGGTKYFKLSDRLETNFIKGIVDIAQKSDAWLLTSGYNVGIVQIVGQAINKVKLTKPNQRITAIGICKWGCIANIEYEIGLKKEKPTQKTTDPSMHEKKRRNSGEWELEMNHTHYLMLDDGTKRHYEIKDFRTKLATHLARFQHDDNIVTIPVVTIVVEGGIDTIKNVYYDLRENVPVVLINGSGRAADFLNRWLLYTKDLENNTQDQEIVYGIDQFKVLNEDHPHERDSSSSNRTSNTCHIDSTYNKLADMFEKYRKHLEEDLKNTVSHKENDTNDLVKYVMYCLQPAVRSDITVFNLNSDSDLSETIFRSICRSRQKLFKRRENERKRKTSISYFRRSEKEQKIQRTRLFNLAMDWNCSDAAREFILKNSLDNIINKNRIFRLALVKNRPLFVYEFLRLKIDLCEVFLPKNDRTLKEFQYKSFIQTLYTIDLVNNGKNHLKCFMDIDKALKKAKVDNVEILNLTLNDLIGDYMYKLYFDSLDEENEHRSNNGLKMKRTRILSNEEKKVIMNDYFLRDLFLWAILMNYTDMAKVLLSHMKYRMCPALIATKIFKQYHHKAPYGDLRKSYEESATYFEQYAVDCLDKCDDHDAAKACEIVLQRNELYGYVTCLQVAADAKDKQFLATPCCVEAMNNVWYDKLHPEQSRFEDRMSLLTGFATFGLAAPVFVSYRKTKKDVKKIKPSDQKMKSNGIDYGDPTSLEYFTPPLSYRAYKRYIPQLVKFHKSLPIKFCYHLVTYTFFLLLFSYVLLFNFSPPTNKSPSIHWTEILTIILVSCMLIEEIHHFFSQDNLSIYGKLVTYFNQPFKLMTFLGIILFYIGLIVRFTYANSEDEFIAARVIMAIDVEIWWLRLLSFIIVIEFLGPHLVSIQMMVKDLVFFMCIIAIFMTGYGVASRSMVYYPVANGFTTATGGSIDTSFDGRSVFHQIIYPIYYMMYGQFSDELATLDSNPNAGWSIATYVLFSIHMMLVNILLVNMLIAMFSKRFDQVYDDTKRIWHSQQYVFTREYYNRAPLFPPISLIYDMWHLCRMVFFYMGKTCFEKAADSKAQVFQIIAIDETIIKDWCEFEEKSTYEYAHNEVKIMKNSSKKTTTGKNKKNQDNWIDVKTDTNNGLEEIEDELSNLNVTIEKLQAKSVEKKDKSTQTQI